MALRAVKEEISSSNKNTLAHDIYRRRFDQQVFQKTEEQLQELFVELTRQGLEVIEPEDNCDKPTPKAVIEKLHGFMKDFTAVDETWIADGYALTFATKRNKLHTKVQHIGDQGFPKAKVTIFYDKSKKSDYPERMARSIAFAAAEYFNVPEEQIRVQSTYVTFESQGIKYELEATGDDYRRRDMTAEYFKDQILDPVRQARAMQLKNRIFQILDVVRDAVATQVDARGRKIPWEECLTNRGRISRDILIQAFNWNQDWRAYMRNAGNEQGNLEPKDDILQLINADIEKMEAQLSAVNEAAQKEQLATIDATIAELKTELAVRQEQAKAKGKETTDKIQKLEKKLLKKQVQREDLLSPELLKKKEGHERIIDLKVLSVLALYYKAEQCLTDYEAREDVVVRQYINAYNRQPGRVLWNNFKDSPFTTEFMKRHIHRNLYLYIIFGALLSFGVLFQIPYYWGYAQKKGELQVEREDLDTVSFDYSTDTFTQSEMEALFKEDWVAMANKYFMNPTEAFGLNFKLEPQAALAQIDQDILLEAQFTKRYALTRFREAAAEKLLKRIPNIQMTISDKELRAVLGEEYSELRPLLANCFLGGLPTENSGMATDTVKDNPYAFLQDSFNFSEETLSGQDTAAAVTASERLVFAENIMVHLAEAYRQTVLDKDQSRLTALDRFGRYVQWAVTQKPVLAGELVRTLFGDGVDSLLGKYFVYDVYARKYAALPEAESALYTLATPEAQALALALQKARVQKTFDRSVISAQFGNISWQEFFTEGLRMFLRPQAMEQIAKLRDNARAKGDLKLAQTYERLLDLVTPQITETTVAELPGSVSSLFERVGETEAWVIRYDFWTRLQNAPDHLKKVILDRVTKLYSGSSGVDRQLIEKRFAAKADAVLQAFMVEPLAKRVQLKQWINIDLEIDEHKKRMRLSDQELTRLELQRGRLAVIADLLIAYPEGIPLAAVQEATVPQEVLQSYCELKEGIYKIRLNTARLTADIQSLDVKIQRIFTADEQLSTLLALRDIFK